LIGKKLPHPERCGSVIQNELSLTRRGRRWR
jgi:hypothetical protein